jgi:glycosyltransferase involved in cell wall biosynthesis
MTDRVSVALCTHNGSRYVETQLKSILGQATPPDEIVLSDDASTDDTVSIAREVLARAGTTAPDLTVLVNSEALGVTKNFEQAIRACTGDLIALSDQDDSWHRNRLARVIPEFDAREDLDLVFTDADLVGADGESLDRTLFGVLEISEADLRAVNSGNAFSVFVRRNIATGATVMFRRRLLERALPFPSSWVHDEWLAIIAAATGNLDAIAEPLIDYRQHAANAIGVAYPTLIRKVRRALEPRGGRNVRLSRQFADLAVRLQSAPFTVSEETLRDALEKSRFEQARVALPSARVLRLGTVLSAHRRGWYSRFASQGRLDVVRDLLQPHSND